MNEDVGIDPWSTDGETDYSRIVNQFGLEKVDYTTIPEPGMLHRRGIRPRPPKFLSSCSNFILIWCLSDLVAPGISMVPCLGFTEKSANPSEEIELIILLKRASLVERSILPLLATPNIEELSG